MKETDKTDINLAVGSFVTYITQNTAYQFCPMCEKKETIRNNPEERIKIFGNEGDSRLVDFLVRVFSGRSVDDDLLLEAVFNFQEP